MYSSRDRPPSYQSTSQAKYFFPSTHTPLPRFSPSPRVIYTTTNQGSILSYPFLSPLLYLVQLEKSTTKLRQAKISTSFPSPHPHSLIHLRHILFILIALSLSCIHLCHSVIQSDSCRGKKRGCKKKGLYFSFFGGVKQLQQINKQETR